MIVIYEILETLQHLHIKQLSQGRSAAHLVMSLTYSGQIHDVIADARSISRHLHLMKHDVGPWCSVGTELEPIRQL